MPERCVVDLTPDKLAKLVALTRKGKASARQVTRAHVLLRAAGLLWRMEDVVDLYAELDDPLRPIVCPDECPYHLLAIHDH